MNCHVIYFQLLLALSVFDFSRSRLRIEFIGNIKREMARDSLREKPTQLCYDKKVGPYENSQIRLIGKPRCRFCDDGMYSVLEENGSYYMVLPDLSHLPKHTYLTIITLSLADPTQSVIRSLILCESSKIMNAGDETPFSKALLVMLGLYDQKCPLKKGKYLISSEFVPHPELNSCNEKILEGSKLKIMLYVPTMNSKLPARSWLKRKRVKPLAMIEIDVITNFGEVLRNT